MWSTASSSIVLAEVVSRTPARVATPLAERAWIVAVPTLPVDPMTRTGGVKKASMRFGLIDGRLEVSQVQRILILL